MLVNLDTGIEYLNADPLHFVWFSITPGTTYSSNVPHEDRPAHALTENTDNPRDRIVPSSRTLYPLQKG